MKFNILALVTDAYGAGGGIAQYNRDFFDALSGVIPAVEINIISRGGCRINIDNQVSQINQFPVVGYKWKYLLISILLNLRKRNIDLIFCGHINLMPVAYALSVISNKPLWLQIHGIEAWKSPNRIQRWIVEKASLVTSVSRYTRSKFLEWANFDPNFVKVLPNTVSEIFYPGKKKVEILDKYALKEKKILLTVSRLDSRERYKGHELVIEALATLIESHPEIVYVIAGDGDDRLRLEKFSKTLLPEGTIRFIGYVEDRELPDLYRAADLFVMPSTGEGFGIVFLQALACNIPVIATNSDGSVDPLRDGADGFLVSPNSVEELCSTISFILSKNSVNPKDNVFNRANFESLAYSILKNHFTTSGHLN